MATLLPIPVSACSPDDNPIVTGDLPAEFEEQVGRLCLSFITLTEDT